MNNYLIRVELHDATAAHYEQLHQHMAGIGFARVIVGDTGQTFTLPPAEYTGQSALSAVQVRDLVAYFARLVVPAVAVVALDFNNAAWLLPLAA